VLTQGENDLITRVGSGTLLGEFWRRFWIPAVLSAELPGADCPPVRVRLLGEDLVAFRASDGSAGLLAAACPHRGASLFFGRNEEDGLRCVYHGWKFDAAGVCVDMPNEPADSNFKHKIRQTAYACTEQGGIVWTYMGPPQSMGELPEMEWMLVAEEQRYVSKIWVECNYLQAIEGDLDNSHSVFLHGKLGGAPGTPFRERLALAAGTIGSALPDTLSRVRAQDTAPRGMLKETDYGIMMGWQRNATDDSYWWHINHFMLPGYTMIAGPPGRTLLCNLQIPMDDGNTWYYRVSWNPQRPLNSEEIESYVSGGVRYPELIPGSFRPLENKDNDYLIDRAVQRASSFTGIKSITQQDRGVQESMGPICDRTREHLGTSDVVIIALRNQILRIANEIHVGDVPFCARTGAVYRMRPVDVVLPRDVAWAEAATGLMTVTV